MTLHRGYLETSFGQLHYAEAGAGPAVLMLHQTPRSLDEFAELSADLAMDHHAIAMDMPGFGLSSRPPGPLTIEAMAAGALALLDGLAIPDAVVVGHHTGAVVAQELAAGAPERVRALVLSAMPWVGPERRSRGGVPVDHATRQDDGGHLVEIWRQRQPYYPPHRPDLLDRTIRDALAPGTDPTEGHRAVGAYVMEQQIGAVRAPTLLLCADRDPFSSPSIDTVAAALTGVAYVQVHHIVDGTIPLMETCTAEVAGVIRSFLATLPTPERGQSQEQE